MKIDTNIAESMLTRPRVYVCAPNREHAIVDMVGKTIFSDVSAADETIFFIDPTPDQNFAHACLYIRLRVGSGDTCVVTHGWGPNERECPVERAYPIRRGPA